MFKLFVLLNVLLFISVQFNEIHVLEISVKTTHSSHVVVLCYLCTTMHYLYTFVHVFSCVECFHSTDHCELCSWWLLYLLQSKTYGY